MSNRHESQWLYSGPPNEDWKYGGFPGRRNQSFTSQQWACEGNPTDHSQVTHGRNANHTPMQQPMPAPPVPSQVPQGNSPAFGFPPQMPPPPPPPPPPQPASSEQTAHGNVPSSKFGHGSPHCNFLGLHPPPQPLPPQPPPPQSGMYKPASQKPQSSPQPGQTETRSQMPNPGPPHLPFPPFAFQHHQHPQQQNPVPHQSSQSTPHHHPADQWQTGVPSNVPGRGPDTQQWDHSETLSNFQQHPAPPSDTSGFPLPPSLPPPNTGPPSQRMVQPGQPRLQPYQSHRIRPKAAEQKTSAPPMGGFQSQGPLHGHRPKLDSFDPALPQNNQSKREAEEEESDDQKWVRQWVKGRQKPELTKDKKSKDIIRLGDARLMLTKFMQLLNDLKETRSEAEDCLMKEADGRWKPRIQEMRQQMVELSSLKRDIDTPEFVEGMRKAVERRQRKRDRKRRNRQAKWEAREEALKLQQEMVDARMAKALQAKQDKEKEEALQKEVDNTLAEVRKKKQDANKTMELLRALRKLRHLRKESADKKGFRGPKELDVLFEERVCGLEEMMNRQKLLYVEEEKALQVMLEEEHEETREKERQKKQMKERQRVEKAWEKQLQLLFGQTEKIEHGHQLFMFRQFYAQGECDIQALVNIRRQWDAFLVPDSDPAGSSIPLSWVLPEKPANHIWETALEDTLGT